MPDLRQSENAVNEIIVSEIIALAWADGVSFDEINQKYGLREKDVIHLMRRHLKRTSFKLWRERVSGRKTKHRALLKYKTSREQSAHRQDSDENDVAVLWPITP